MFGPSSRREWQRLAEALAAGGLALPEVAARHLPAPARARRAPASVLLIARQGNAEAPDLRRAEDLGASAVAALRRWRHEPRDADALAEGVARLAEATRVLAQLAPEAEHATRDLAWTVARSTQFGPEDGQVVFRRSFEALARKHLAGILPPPPRKAQDPAAPSPARATDAVPGHGEGAGRVLPRNDAEAGLPPRPSRVGPEPS